MLGAGTSLTFLQNYTVLLFSPEETNVCPLGISQSFWQQAADEEQRMEIFNTNTQNGKLVTLKSMLCSFFYSFLVRGGKDDERTLMVGADSEEKEPLLEDPNVPVASG